MHVLHTLYGKMELGKLTGDRFVSVLLMLESPRHVEAEPIVSDVRRNGIQNRLGYVLEMLECDW
jgi:hypothetical protein